MLAIGTKAPDFTLPDQNGEPRSLSDYKGHTEALTGLGTQLEQMSDHLLRAADISVEAEDMAAEVLRRLLGRREGEQGYER